MATDIMKQAGLFLLFLAAQVLVLGRIHLFHCATPLFYVYFVTMFARNYPKWALLLWGFFLGLLVDVFYNTPGLAAGSLVLIAAIQPYWLELFAPHDSADSFEPSLRTLGPTKYVWYLIPLVSLYCVVFFSLEFFNLSDMKHWAMCVVGSTIITLLLIFTFEIARGKE
jgi:rod shape-determining protein MreD